MRALLRATRGLAPRSPSLPPLPLAIAVVAAAPSLPKLVRWSLASTTLVVVKRGAARQARAVVLDPVVAAGRDTARAGHPAAVLGVGSRRILGMPGQQPRGAVVFLFWMVICGVAWLRRSWAWRLDLAMVVGQGAS
jgi:hypothetical protein